MAATPKLSKEAFIQLAAQIGLDTGDRAHMDELYGHVQEIMATVSELRKIGLGEVQPAIIYSAEGG